MQYNVEFFMTSNRIEVKYLKYLPRVGILSWGVDRICVRNQTELLILILCTYCIIVVYFWEG